MTGVESDGAVSPVTTPRVLSALTAALERLVSRNDALVTEEAADQRGLRSPPPRGALDVFRAARVPSISVGKYLERLYQYSDCSPSCFVLGFAYIDRLVHRHPSSFLLSVNVHRLILTSVMVASKVLDDVHHSNAFYAKVGGVSAAELNRLELELLFLLDFGVTVGSLAFEGYCLHLEKEMKLSNGGAGLGDDGPPRRERADRAAGDGGRREGAATVEQVLVASPRKSF